VALAVKGVVDEQVNPALAAHGGYVTFMGHDGEGKVFLTMGGGCHGCAMSRMTMLEGVQTMIIEAVPTITKVVDATDHSTGENPYYS
jgi:Fe/S biogenesis protein NfuA